MGYTGDTVVNSLGDLVCCAVGVLIARRLGGRATCLLFFAIEGVLITTIRDSLVLNVLMLLVPLESLQQWQQG